MIDVPVHFYVYTKRLPCGVKVIGPSVYTTDPKAVTCAGCLASKHYRKATT